MRIHVVTNVAVGAVVVDGGRIPVTSDGTLLRDVSAPKRLPTIPMRSAPGGRRVTEPAALAAVAALGAAPASLRRRVEDIVTTPEHGLTIQLAHGPALWFGRPERLNAKWAAAAAVLADPEAAGASYDRRDGARAPGGRRPVGGLPPRASRTCRSRRPTSCRRIRRRLLRQPTDGAAAAVDPATETTVP